MRAERHASAVAVAALTAFVLVVGGGFCPVRAVPLQFTVQGRLTDANGVNRDGSFTITVRLWSAPFGGTLLYKETRSAIPVANGNFQLLVGGSPDADSPKPSLDQVFAGDAAYLEFQAFGETPMVPRQVLLSVPYSMKANVADALSTPARFSIAVSSVSLPRMNYSGNDAVCFPGSTLRFSVQAGQAAQLMFHGPVGNTGTYHDTSIGVILDGIPRGSYCHTTSVTGGAGMPCAIDYLTAPLTGGEHTACLLVRTYVGEMYFLVDSASDPVGRRAVFEVRVPGGLP